MSPPAAPGDPPAPIDDASDARDARVDDDAPLGRWRGGGATAAPGPAGGYPEAERWALVPLLPDGRVVLVRPRPAPPPPAAPASPEAQAADAETPGGATTDAAGDHVPPGGAAPRNAAADAAAWGANGDGGRWCLLTVPALVPPAAAADTADTRDTAGTTDMGNTGDPAANAAADTTADGTAAARRDHIAVTLHSRLDLAVTGEPVAAAERLPVRLRHPRHGTEGHGWLRAVRVPVHGEPRADPLLADVAALPPEEATRHLSTERERRLLAAALAAPAAGSGDPAPTT